jgi:transposase
MFDHWHRYKDGSIDRPSLQHRRRPIRQTFEATLQQVVGLGVQRGERTAWACTVRNCHQLLKVTGALWTFLEIEEIEPTNNAAELP